MKVQKRVVLYAAQWTGDVDAVLAVMRDGVRARHGGYSDSKGEDGSGWCTFVAEVRAELLVLTQRHHELSRGTCARGEILSEDICEIARGQWVVYDESDDQGDYLHAMAEEDFHTLFVEAPSS